MVIDRMAEWDRGDAGARSVEQAAKLIDGGARLVIVRTSDAVRSAVEACGWARDHRELAGVAIPEAHRVAPNSGRLPTEIEDAACAWRHHRVSLWLDTQRIALLSRTLTEQARLIRIYAVVGELDLRTIAELGGRELGEAVRMCAARLHRGEPGWHVALGLVRTPPYALEREGQPTKRRR